MAKRSRKKQPRSAGPARPAAAVAAKSPAADREWLWAALIFLAAVIAYSPVWWAGYVWDDDFMVTANVHIVGPLGLKGIWTSTAADICPLTLTTIWFIHALFGLAPLPYHLVNVVLHGLCGVVLWRVLQQLRVPGAWLGAALWTLHPVEVESVAWISEMKNAQSGLFFLLTIHFFLRTLSGGEGKACAAWGWNEMLMLLFAALAMASKSSTVILPLVLLLCAWWIESRWSWRVVVKVSPIFLLSIAAGLLTLWTQQWNAGQKLPFERSWSERFATAGDAIWFYLGKLVWPHPLLMVYPRWDINAADMFAYAPLVVEIVVAAIFWMNRKTWGRPWLFAFAYFVIALLPVLGFVTNSFSRYSFVADHFQYLASMGPIALVGALLTRAADHFAPRKVVLQSALAALLLLLAGTLTWCQAWNYQTQEKLWIETLKYNPDCWEALTNLGNILLDRGQVDDAIPLFQKALKSDPNSAVTYYNLGLAMCDKGRKDEGAADYGQALKIWPDYAVAHNALGLVLLDAGKFDDAQSHFQQAIDANPMFGQAHYNLARVFVQKGDTGNAIIEFRNAAMVKPNFAAAEFALGGFLAREGQIDEGITHLRKALAIEPNNDQIHGGLGIALAKKGQVADAIAEFQAALKLNPRNEQADYDLGRLSMQSGQVDVAMGYFQDALKIFPGDADAHNNLGVALVQKGRLTDAIAEFKEAVRLRPGYTEAKNNLATAQAQAAKTH